MRTNEENGVTLSGPVTNA